MNRFNEYMQDRSVENALNDEEKERLTRNHQLGDWINALEGITVDEDVSNYALYCSLNKVDSRTAMDVVFKVLGLNPINWEKVDKSKAEYEKYKKSLTPKDTNL